jgi:hypothetical protein
LLDRQLAFEAKQLAFQDNEVHRQGGQAALPGKQLHGRHKWLACLASELRCQGKQLALLGNGLAFLARKAASMRFVAGEATQEPPARASVCLSLPLAGEGMKARSLTGCWKKAGQLTAGTELSRRERALSPPPPQSSP